MCRETHPTIGTAEIARRAPRSRLRKVGGGKQGGGIDHETWQHDGTELCRRRGRNGLVAPVLENVDRHGPGLGIDDPVFPNTVALVERPLQPQIAFPSRRREDLDNEVGWAEDRRWTNDIEPLCSYEDEIGLDDIAISFGSSIARVYLALMPSTSTPIEASIT